MPLYPRDVSHKITEAFGDTRVVLVTGPRQAGKTTLAETIARENGLAFHSLDNPTALAAARRDPVGFLRATDRAAIDEIQRVPDLLLAIKERVDRDPRPGQFLLTGSANLMSLSTVADSLAGRMEVIHLLPLSMRERSGRQNDLLENVFQGKPPSCGAPILGDALLDAVLAGGYPEAIARATWRRRQSWYRQYLDAILHRDVQEIARIDDLARMPQLMRLLAEHAGKLVNYSSLGAEIGVTHVTTRRYLDVFANLFLVQTLAPWYRNRGKRLIKTPKLHFLDSGLLASLRELSPERLARDRTDFGPVLESFVFSELLKLAAASDLRISFSHFRDKEKNEVDIVLEDGRGRVVGIEVKAAATVTAADFHGMRRLAAACGEDFACGIVLYDHDRTVPFGERLFAVPLSALW